MTRNIQRRLRKLESQARPIAPEQQKKAGERVVKLITEHIRDKRHSKEEIDRAISEFFALALGYSSVAEANKARDRRDPEYFARAEEFWNRAKASKDSSGNTDESA